LSAPKYYPQFDECTDTKYVPVEFPRGQSIRRKPPVFAVRGGDNSGIGQSNLSKTLLGLSDKGLVYSNTRNSISKYKRKGDTNFFYQLIFIVLVLGIFGYFFIDMSLLAIVLKNLQSSL